MLHVFGLKKGKQNEGNKICNKQQCRWPSQKQEHEILHTMKRTAQFFSVSIMTELVHTESQAFHEVLGFKGAFSASSGWLTMIQYRDRLATNNAEACIFHTEFQIFVQV